MWARGIPRWAGGCLRRGCGAVTGFSLRSEGARRAGRGACSTAFNRAGEWATGESCQGYLRGDPRGGCGSLSSSGRRSRAGAGRARGAAQAPRLIRAACWQLAVRKRRRDPSGVVDDDGVDPAQQRGGARVRASRAAPGRGAALAGVNRSGRARGARGGSAAATSRVFRGITELWMSSGEIARDTVSRRPGRLWREMCAWPSKAPEALPDGDSPACLTSDDELSYRRGSPVSAEIAAAPTAVSPGTSASRDRPSSPSTAAMSASTARSWARALQVAQLIGAPPQQRRRWDTTTASVLASAANTAGTPGWRAVAAPGHGLADQGGEFGQPGGGQLPAAAAPRRHTCIAAEVTTERMRARLRRTAGDDRNGPAAPTRSRRDQLGAPRPGGAAAPTPHPAPPGHSSAARSRAGRSSRSQTHHFYASCNPAAGGRYARRAAGCTPAAAPLRASAHLQRRAPVGSHATATVVTPSPALPDRPVQRLTSRNAFTRTSYAPAPHIMINHRDRLLLISLIDPDHRAITRQHPRSRPAARPPPVTARHPAAAATLPTECLLPALGHEVRTIAPGGVLYQ